MGMSAMRLELAQSNITIEIRHSVALTFASLMCAILLTFVGLLAASNDLFHDKISDHQKRELMVRWRIRQQGSCIASDIRCSRSCRQIL